MRDLPDYRPGFHFAPARHWMNDPNGLVHHQGRWHLFFQYNPQGNDWGNMSWGHASSPDLVRWTEHPVALPHRPGEEEIWSGCVVVDHHNTSGFGEPDGPPPLVAVHTSLYADGRQAQSLAWSTDGGEAWTSYDGNPVLDRGSRHFRDPKVFWQPNGGYGRGEEAGHWVMVAVEAEARQVLLHRSDDLRSWTPLSSFGPIDEAEHLWECPDLFPLPVDGEPGGTAWVLVVSVNPGAPAGGSGTRYVVGDFDGTTFTPRSDGPAYDEAWMDWGRDFYAAVTFDNAPGGRRVAIGWMSNWDYAAHVPTAPWRGSMAVPRELSLRRVDGVLRLHQQPVAELAALEATAEPVAAQPFDLTGERDLPGGARYRLDLVLEPVDAEQVGLDLLVGPGQTTLLRYAPATGVLGLDRRGSGEVGFSDVFPSHDTVTVPLREGRLRLQVLVDRTSVEVFAQDGAICLTQLVFAPDASTGARLVSLGGRTRVVELVHRPLG